MKVLMFGWEFPPHISGGLGTACYGLTTALVAEGVKVRFVVPKLRGDEPSNGTKLINASEVKAHVSKAQILRKRALVEVEEGRGLSKIEIPAKLSPYNSASMGAPVDPVEHWSHQFTTSTAESTLPIKRRSSQVKTTHSFQGGYGVQLVDEVFRYATVAAEIAALSDFDVIHAHDWMTYPAGMAAKKASGKPLVIHVHATEHDRAGSKGSKAVYKIEKDGMASADRIVAVSQWTKNIIISNYEVEPQKISVVHNGIIPEEVNSREEFHPVGSQVVTFLGRITYQKGPEYFVEAAEKVLKTLPDVHFIMAGAGDYLPRIIAKVAKLKLSSHFHFTGFLKKEDINKVLSYTRVYVMPSVSEPFGITPLEAIQAGVPVIISNQSGVGEVLPHALKVDFWDTQALARAICSLLKYKSLSQTLKKNGEEEIASITWKKAAQNLTTIYNEINATNQ